MKIPIRWIGVTTLAALLTANGLAPKKPQDAKPVEASTSTGTVSKATVDDLLADWPDKAREAAEKIVAKYGLPAEASTSMLMWHGNGPWKHTIAYREEVAHDFPMPHKDVVEQFIDYRVRVDKFDDLAQYDGSVICERTKGEISARCDKEEMNFLALNLARDIVDGKSTVQEAREFYAKTPWHSWRARRIPTPRACRSPSRPARLQIPTSP
jgi:hypothetical protein